MLVYSQSFAVKSCSGDTLYYKTKGSRLSAEKGCPDVLFTRPISRLNVNILYKRDGCAMRITDRFSAVADK